MLFIALMMLVAGAFASCVTDPYTPGEPVSGPQVFFPKNNPTSIGFLEEEGKGKFELTLKRVATEKPLWVYIIVEPHDNMDKESIKEFGMPEEYEAYFEAGSDTATIEMEVADLSKLYADKTYTYNFIIEDVYSTPYGDKEWRVDFSIDPWLLVKDANGNNAKAKLRAVSAISSFWEAGSVQELEFDLYKHKNLEQYKVKNPWVEIFELAFGVDESLLSDPTYGMFSFSSADLVFDCTNPNNVIIEKQSTGVNEFAYGYGIAYIEGNGGILDDGIITFPPYGITFAHEKIFEMYPNYSWADFKSNTDGMFRLLFPGVKATDFALSLSYNGMEVGLDHENAYAKFALSYGTDVAGVKYIIVDGDIEYYSDQINTIVDTIVAGADENICTIEGLVKGEGSHNVKLALQHGLYTIVAVPFDDNGKARSRDAVATPFYFVGLGATQDLSCQLDVALKDVGTTDFSQLSAYPDYSSMALVVKGELLKSAQYIFAETTDLNLYIKEEMETGKYANEQEVYDYLLATQGISIAQEKIMETHNGGQMISFIGGADPEVQLTPETNYSILIKAKNSYDKEALAIKSFDTSSAPKYNGELVLGDYTMSCLYTYKENDVEKNFLSESLFTLKNIVGSNDQFFVTNLGNNDDLSWYASYDSAKHKLTLYGYIQGMKLWGNALGAVQVATKIDSYGNMLECYTYLSYNPKNENSMGLDPIIFDIDATNNQPIGLLSDVILPVFDPATYEELGIMRIYLSNKTTITPYVPEEIKADGSQNGGNSDDRFIEKENSDNSNTNNTINNPYSKSLSIPFCSKGVIKVLKPYSKQLRTHSISGYAAPTQPKLRFVKPTAAEAYTPEAKELRSFKFNAR